MKNQDEIQERFLKEEPRMKLGHLASDLARIASLFGINEELDTVKTIIQEGKFFAEWTAPEVELEIQVLLAEIQSFLTQTELAWDSLWRQPGHRESVARQCRLWSDELLKKAGFLDHDEGN